MCRPRVCSTLIAVLTISGLSLVARADEQVATPPAQGANPAAAKDALPTPGVPTKSAARTKPADHTLEKPTSGKEAAVENVGSPEPVPAAPLDDLKPGDRAIAERAAAEKAAAAKAELQKRGWSGVLAVPALMPSGSLLIPPAVLIPPLPRFAAQPAKVDLNSASLSQLQDLPGVGAAWAPKLLAGRPYRTIDDVARDGIPLNVIEQIRSLVVFGP